MRALFGFLSVLILSAGLVSGHEEDDRGARPDPGSEPAVVYVAMGLLDVDEISSSEQNFIANLYVRLQWTDPRLAHASETPIILPLTEVWHPHLLFVNQQKIWSSLPEEVAVSSKGVVTYSQRVWGPFSQPMDVREFPFDHQTFEMRLASSRYRPNELSFKKHPDWMSLVADELSLPDWDIISYQLDFSTYKPTSWGGESASVAFEFRAERYVRHYMLKVVLPLILIVMMSWIVFWIDPSQSGVQIGVATTSMLTLIAYRFSLVDELPPVPYLTKMDYLVVASTMLVFVALLQAVVTSGIHAMGKTHRAESIDRICRFVFPAAFGVILLLTVF